MVLKITNLHILRYLSTYWLYLLECYTIDNQRCTHTASECRNKTVKQAYLFSCYCGLRLSDMETLCWKDIICNDGRYMIGKVQQKTSTPIYTPLSQSAVKWMPERKADDSDETLVFATLPSRMTTNKILRQWVEKAGIDKKITYHTSRHTFGTMMMTVGADLYTTCKLMGHADVRTTQIYASAPRLVA